MTPLREMYQNMSFQVRIKYMKQFCINMDHMKRGPNTLIMLVYLVFGLYFINQPFQFIQIPESFSIAEPWIIFVGGILIILGAVNYFKVRRRPY